MIRADHYSTNAGNWRKQRRIGVPKEDKQKGQVQRFINLHPWAM
jgi:hypothetical protein